MDNRNYFNPYAPYYQPQFAPQPQPAPMQNNNAGINWVQGEAGAKSFFVANGQSVLLLDSENPILYVKSADASGIPSLRAFDLAERGAKTAQDMSEYITRTEFEERLAKMKEAE